MCGSSGTAGSGGEIHAVYFHQAGRLGGEARRNCAALAREVSLRPLQSAGKGSRPIRLVDSIAVEYMLNE